LTAFHAFIAISLDGFIARQNGDVKWLDQIPKLENEDYGYGALFARVDAMVLGRKTYEKVRSFDVPWPYEGKRVIVLSRTESTPEPDAPPNVERFAGQVTSLVEKLSKEGVQAVYVDGGQMIQAFLRAGLLEEITITRVPILLGAGIPLFGTHEDDIPMQHIVTKAYSNGLVQSIYHPVPRT
jgi:dihydrofolate reductase